MNRKVWGHRGCRGLGYPPENSLSAFQTAIDSGVGGIEFDIQLSQDGFPVVFHDDDLARMTGIAAGVSSLSLGELKRLRLLTPEGKPSKQEIPTLAEVLDLVARHRPSALDFVVNIELKDPASPKAVAAMVRERINQGWNYRNFLISSFDISCLREIRELLPEVPIGALFDCAPEELASKLEETKDLKPNTVNIPSASLTPEVTELLAAAGATPVVWTPNESNPNLLPPLARERLVKNLREREFVAITDFPKELLSFLKPSKTKATVTGVLAACLAFSQQDMLFRPSELGLETLKSPADYPELQRFGFHEFSLTAEDGVLVNVWERRGALDRPHFVLFHGNRAHWGDTGIGDASRDRRARLKFISELASSGAGVTAVTLRGFGKSAAVPSETGFLLDLRAVADHIACRGFHHQRLVVAGESLGTWAATQTAVYLTQRNTPPALLSLQNPFTSMAEVGEDVVSHFAIVRSLNIALSASSLDRHILKSHFYTANLVRHLTTGTVLHIATSGKDNLVHPSHSDKLAEIAQRRNLHVVRDLFADALHSTIPPVEFARRLLGVGVQSCLPPNPLWGGSHNLQSLASVDHLIHL